MKTLIRCFYLINMSVFNFISYSQSAGTYFPLHINNEWTFSYPNFLHTEEIADTNRINGKLYYGLTIWTSHPQYWFRESNDSVYVLDTLTNIEILLYNFNAEVGESWELIPDFNCWLGNEITLISKNDTVATPIGTFTNCYHFVHQQNCADAGIYDSWFAKGIGRVRYQEDNFTGMLDYKLISYVVFPPVGVEGKSADNISYSLSQNYPNPFNPATKIKYSIPNVETRHASPLRVILKVYDVLGREVATLVNEEKQPGVYEVEFNAGNLSSGIYYYQLKAGNFIEAEKMILIR